VNESRFIAYQSAKSSSKYVCVSFGIEVRLAQGEANCTKGSWLPAVLLAPLSLITKTRVYLWLSFL
jgi:hypothetical protein